VLRWAGTRPASRMSRRSSAGGTSWPYDAPAEVEIATRNREMAARLTWKPYMHNPRLAHFLPRVTNPTLIVWGREDRVVPVECGEQYRRLLPNADLTVLERCGHLPPVEQPEIFARLVLDFLGGHNRR